jgi:hypothetical protein
MSKTPTDPCRLAVGQNVELDQVRNQSKFERRDSGDWEAGLGPTVIFAALLGGYYEELEIVRAYALSDLGTGTWSDGKARLPFAPQD